MVRRSLVLLAVLLLQACSAIKLGYNQLPTLGSWWLDNQLSFDSGQTPAVREALQQLHRWHRERELPVYADLLQKLQGLSPRELESRQVCEVWAQVDDGLNRAMAQTVRLAAPLALQLQPRQLRHLVRHWEDKNEQWENQWLRGSPQERFKRRLERTVSRYSDFYGPLSESQTELLRSHLQASVWSPQWGRQERLRRQQMLLTALQTLQTAGTSVVQAEAALLSVWQQWFLPPTEADRQIYKQLVEQSCRNLAEFHNSTSAEQRARAQRRLRSYERELRELTSSS